ncbi:MAG: protoporphyrinogen oxidase HemJ, partial [Chitinophagales bacterium]
MTYYPYLIALHIIFIITWFAALFYIVRLFVYHTEAIQKPEPEKTILSEQFEIMEKRLMNIIGTPSMILVLITGISLLTINKAFIYDSWMQLKLFFVACLIVYHFICLNILKKLTLKKSKLSSQQLRLFNEVTTIILFGIVFLVELKN